MELDKIRNLGAHELKHEEQQAAEQLFRLRFQMKLGQTEGVKKLRGLRKDIARIKTIARERELGLRAASHGSAALAASSTEKSAKPAKASKAKSATKTVAKTASRAGKKSGTTKREAR
jgi:large subunit ribosomal protein L29